MKDGGIRQEKAEGADGERLMPDGYYDRTEIAAHLNRYAFAAKFVNGKTCLDVACGSGYGSHYLLGSGARTVVAGDISPKSIQAARTRYVRDGLHFVLIDAQQLPFQDAAFDVVVSLETIEHLQEPRRFLSECQRVLKRGGLLICSTPNTAIYDRPVQRTPTLLNPFAPSSYHVKEFSIDELRSLLAGAHLAEIAIYGQNFVKKNIVWRSKVFARGLAWRLILHIPRGKSILSFLNRAIFRQQCVSLGELRESELRDVHDDIMPLLQERRLGVPVNIIVVAVCIQRK